MRRQSPQDLESQDTHTEEAGPLRPLGEAAFYWRYKPSFGAWLREARERRGLTLRAAAAELGISFTKLQKLEVSGRNKAPSLGLLQRFATLYGRPLGEVLEAAGVEVVLPPDVYADVNRDVAFAALVLHPSLRPMRMDGPWLDAFSPVQKQQWVEFALRLESHLAAGGTSVSEILRQAVGGPDAGETVAAEEEDEPAAEPAEAATLQTEPATPQAEPTPARTDPRPALQEDTSDPAPADPPAPPRPARRSRRAP